MKNLLPLFLLLLSNCCFSQDDYYPCKFKLVDASTKLPIKGASVTIDQMGARTIKTEPNGFCDFKSLPVGRIDITISHPDYRSDRIQRTVSSEVKNNSYIIEMVPNSENSLLITGKIRSEGGIELNNVNIEAKIDGIAYRASSDEYGNYRLDIVVNSFRSDRIQMDFKKGNCRYSEEVLIPQRRYLEKSIKLNCQQYGSAPTKSNISGVWELTIKSKYYVRKDGTLQRSGVQIGGLLNLTQEDNTISGTFGSGNWIQCGSGQINGRINSDSIELEITCTKGSCLGSSTIVIAGRLLNNVITGEIKPPVNKSTDCTVWVGPLTLTREK
jgi:hypothetical protein